MSSKGGGSSSNKGGGGGGRKGDEDGAEEFDFVPHTNTLCKSGLAHFSDSAHALAELVDNSIQYTLGIGQAERRVDVYVMELSEGASSGNGASSSSSASSSLPPRPPSSASSSAPPLSAAAHKPVSSLMVVADNGVGMNKEQLKAFCTYYLGQKERGLTPRPHGSRHSHITSILSKFGVGAIEASFYLASQVKVVTRDMQQGQARSFTLDEKELTEKDQRLRERTVSGKDDGQTGEQPYRAVVQKKATVMELLTEQEKQCQPLVKLINTFESRKHFTMLLLRLRPNRAAEFQSDRASALAHKIAHMHHYYLRPDDFPELTDSRGAKRGAETVIALGSGPPFKTRKVGTEGRAEGVENGADGNRGLGVAMSVTYLPAEESAVKYNLGKEGFSLESQFIHLQRGRTYTFTLNVKLPGTGDHLIPISGICRYYPYEDYKHTRPSLKLIMRKSGRDDDMGVSDDDEKNGGDAEGANDPTFDVRWMSRLLPEGTIYTLPFFRKTDQKTLTELGDWKRRIHGTLFINTWDISISNNKLRILGQGGETFESILGTVVNDDPQRERKKLTDGFRKWIEEQHKLYDKEQELVGRIREENGRTLYQEVKYGSAAKDRFRQGDKVKLFLVSKEVGPSSASTATGNAGRKVPVAVYATIAHFVVNGIVKTDPHPTLDGYVAFRREPTSLLGDRIEEAPLRCLDYKKSRCTADEFDGQMAREYAKGPHSFKVINYDTRKQLSANNSLEVGDQIPSVRIEVLDATGNPIQAAANKPYTQVKVKWELTSGREMVEAHTTSKMYDSTAYSFQARTMLHHGSHVLRISVTTADGMPQLPDKLFKFDVEAGPPSGFRLEHLANQEVLVSHASPLQGFYVTLEDDYKHETGRGLDVRVTITSLNPRVEVVNAKSLRTLTANGNGDSSSHSHGGGGGGSSSSSAHMNGGGGKRGTTPTKLGGRKRKAGDDGGDDEARRSRLSNASPQKNGPKPHPAGYYLGEVQDDNTVHFDAGDWIVRPKDGDDDDEQEPIIDEWDVRTLTVELRVKVEVLESPTDEAGIALKSRVNDKSKDADEQSVVREYADIPITLKPGVPAELQMATLPSAFSVTTHPSGEEVRTLTAENLGAIPTLELMVTDANGNATAPEQGEVWEATVLCDYINKPTATAPKFKADGQGRITIDQLVAKLPDTERFRPGDEDKRTALSIDLSYIGTPISGPRPKPAYVSGTANEGLRVDLLLVVTPSRRPFSVLVTSTSHELSTDNKKPVEVKKNTTITGMRARCLDEAGRPCDMQSVIDGGAHFYCSWDPETVLPKVDLPDLLVKDPANIAKTYVVHAQLNDPMARPVKPFKFYTQVKKGRPARWGVVGPKKRDGRNRWWEHGDEPSAACGEPCPAIDIFPLDQNGEQTVIESAPEDKTKWPYLALDGGEGRILDAKVSFDRNHYTIAKGWRIVSALGKVHVQVRDSYVDKDNNNRPYLLPSTPIKPIVITRGLPKTVEMKCAVLEHLDDWTKCLTMAADAHSQQAEEVRTCTEGSKLRQFAVRLCDESGQPAKLPQGTSASITYTDSAGTGGVPHELVTIRDVSEHMAKTKARAGSAAATASTTPDNPQQQQEVDEEREAVIEFPDFRAHAHKSSAQTQWPKELHVRLELRDGRSSNHAPLCGFLPLLRLIVYAPNMVTGVRLRPCRVTSSTPAPTHAHTDSQALPTVTTTSDASTVPLTVDDIVPLLALTFDTQDGNPLERPIPKPQLTIEKKPVANKVKDLCAVLYLPPVPAMINGDSYGFLLKPRNTKDSQPTPPAGRYLVKARHFERREDVCALLDAAKCPGGVQEFEVMTFQVSDGAPRILAPKVAVGEMTSASNRADCPESRSVVPSNGTVSIVAKDSRGTAVKCREPVSVTLRPTAGIDTSKGRIPQLEKEEVVNQNADGEYVFRRLRLRQDVGDLDGTYEVVFSGEGVEPYVHRFLFTTDLRRQQELAQLNEALHPLVQYRQTRLADIKEYNARAATAEQAIKVLFQERLNTDTVEVVKTTFYPQGNFKIPSSRDTSHAIHALRAKLADIQRRAGPSRRARWPSNFQTQRDYLARQLDSKGYVFEVGWVDDRNLAELLSWYAGEDAMGAFIVADRHQAKRAQEANCTAYALASTAPFMVRVPSGGRDRGWRPRSEAEMQQAQLQLPKISARGFVGYAVNLIKLSPQHEYLRDKVFWSIYNQMAVFETWDQATSYGQHCVEHNTGYKAPPMVTLDGWRVSNTGLFKGKQKDKIDPRNLQFVYGATPVEERGDHKEVKRALQAMEDTHKFVEDGERAKARVEQLRADPLAIAEDARIADLERRRLELMGGTSTVPAFTFNSPSSGSARASAGGSRGSGSGSRGQPANPDTHSRNTSRRVTAL